LLYKLKKRPLLINQVEYQIKNNQKKNKEKDKVLEKVSYKIMRMLIVIMEKL
jgi:hypothetical protein